MSLSFKTIYSYVLEQKTLPVWIVALNFGSLCGIFIYPFAAIATYARLGDPTFYQPTKIEYLLIYTYPILLMLITFFSYKIFKTNKIIFFSITFSCNVLLFSFVTFWNSF